jgi:hypothetical protein
MRSSRRVTVPCAVVAPPAHPRVSSPAPARLPVLANALTGVRMSPERRPEREERHARRPVPPCSRRVRSGCRRLLCQLAASWRSVRGAPPSPASNRGRGTTLITPPIASLP